MSVYLYLTGFKADNDHYQPPAGDGPPRRPAASYHFVDLIRFISMIGIVWAHVELYPPIKNASGELLTDVYMEAFIPYKQIFKFAVICFFMISGFLVGDKISEVSPLAYFKRRLNGTLAAYLVAFVAFISLVIIKACMDNSGWIGFSAFLQLTKLSLFNTFFWYLPNYLISLAIILIFRNYLQSLLLGGTLLALTMLYTVLSVYTSAYAGGHTTAVFGFVFYLWLGAYIQQKGMVAYIINIKTWVLVLTTVVLFALSSAESYWLFKKGLPYFNILHVFNQLYSVAMFALLVKIGQRKLNYGIFNPRKETYGIYLYHGFFVWFLFPKLAILFKKYGNIVLYSYSTIPRLVMMTGYTIVCYGLTIILVKGLLRFKLAYLS